MIPRVNALAILVAALVAFTSAEDGAAGFQVDDKLRQMIIKMSQHIEEMSQHIEDQDATIRNLQEKSTAETMGMDRRLQSIDDLSMPLDTIWLILCGALVMLMQSGFTMLEAGACRVNHVQQIMFKNITDVCIGTVAWFICGYTFAYRGDYDADSLRTTNFGYKPWASVGFSSFNSTTLAYEPDTSVASPTPYCHWFFQWAFCATAATIVSGGVAERIPLAIYLFFTTILTAFIYPVVVAWTWGYGWIAQQSATGYIDFAGSGVVHMVGGVAALVGAIAVGPRYQRFEQPHKFSPHNLPFMVLGTFILWFGWYGFNCGSTLGMSTSDTAALAGLVAMNTTLSAAAGGITVGTCFFLYEKFKFNSGAVCNGILAGLVSITAGCGNVDVGSALLIGVLGGFIYTGSSLLVGMMKIDDPVDAFSVHGACGAWGVLAAVIFDWGKGFGEFHGWSGFYCILDDDGACMSNAWSESLEANVVEIVMIIVWSGGLSSIILGAFFMAGLVRVSPDQQKAGDGDHFTDARAYVFTTSPKSSPKSMVV